MLNTFYKVIFLSVVKLVALYILNNILVTENIWWLITI